MENASKALIIAGAILLSIAIIGIGMYVYQMAASTIDSADMSGQQVTAYNSEFIKYSGTQKGTNAKALCDTIRNHNASNSTDVTKQIVLTKSADLTGKTLSSNETNAAGTPSNGIETIKNGIVAGKNYNISFDYTATGMIKKINIKEK